MKSWRQCVSGGWFLLWLLSVFGVACVPPRVSPPSPAMTADLQQALAILPAPTDVTSQANQNLGAALLISSVLDGTPASRPLYDVLQLTLLTEQRCLQAPAWTLACLGGVHSGPRVLVSMGTEGVLLTLQTGADQPERTLGPLSPLLPTEQLLPLLQQWLSIQQAPPPTDVQEAPRPEKGLCLSATNPGAARLRLELLGRHVRRNWLAARPPSEEAVNADTEPPPSVPTLFELALLSEPKAVGDGAATSRHALSRSRLEALQANPTVPCGFSTSLQVLGWSAEKEEDRAILSGLLTRQRPLNDLSLLSWALALQHSGRETDSVAVLQRALWLAPKRLLLRRHLADTLIAEKRIPDARRLLVEGIRLTPDPGEQSLLELDLGRLEEEGSTWKSAILHYQRGISLLEQLEPSQPSQPSQSPTQDSPSAQIEPSPGEQAPGEQAPSEQAPGEQVPGEQPPTEPTSVIPVPTEALVASTSPAAHEALAMPSPVMIRRAELQNALGAAMVSQVLDGGEDGGFFGSRNRLDLLEQACQTLEKSVAVRDSVMRLIGNASYPQSGNTLEEALLKGEPPSECLANSLYNLGICRAQREEWPACVISMSRAATLYGGETGLQTLLDLARMLHEAGLTNEALETLSLVQEAAKKAGTSLPPEIEAGWHYLHGLAIHLTGQFQPAVDELRLAASQYHALEMPLEESRTYFNLGIILQHQGPNDGVLLYQSLEAFVNAQEAALKAHDNASVLEIEARIKQLGKVAEKMTEE